MKAEEAGGATGEEARVGMAEEEEDRLSLDGSFSFWLARDEVEEEGELCRFSTDNGRIVEDEGRRMASTLRRRKARRLDQLSLLRFFLVPTDSRL